MSIERKVNEEKGLNKNEALRLAVATLAKFASDVLMAGKATERGCRAAFKAIVILARISGLDFEKIAKEL